MNYSQVFFAEQTVFNLWGGKTDFSDSIAAFVGPVFSFILMNRIENYRILLHLKWIFFLIVNKSKAVKSSYSISGQLYSLLNFSAAALLLSFPNLGLLKYTYLSANILMKKSICSQSLVIYL